MGRVGEGARGCSHDVCPLRVSSPSIKKQFTMMYICGIPYTADELLDIAIQSTKQGNRVMQRSDALEMTVCT